MKKFFFIVIFIFISNNAYSNYTKEDLYKIMLSSSPNIKQSELELKRAYNSYKAQEGNLYPRFDYAFSGAYIANPKEPVYITYNQASAQTESELPISVEQAQGVTQSSSSQQGYMNIYPGMEDTNYTSALTMTWPLDTFGKITNYVNINKEIYNSTKYAVDLNKKRAKNMLFSSCDVISCIDKMETQLFKANEAADELILLSTSSYESGMITYSKNTQAATYAYKIKAAYQKTLSQRDDNLETIRTLTGVYDLKLDDINCDNFDINRFLTILDKDSKDFVSLSTSSDKEIMKMRKSAENRARSAYNISKFNMPYSPDLFLFATIGYNTSRFPFIETDWYGKGEWQGVVGLTLRGTLFDGFSQYKNKHAAKNGLKEEKEMTRMIKRDIEDATSKVVNAIKSSIAEINYKNAEKIEKDLAFLEAGTKYNEGSSSKIDYLTALIQSAISSVELNNEYIKLIMYCYALETMTE